MLAKQKKIDFIDAEITQLRAPYPLPENADIGKLITAEQENLFLSESGLERSRPDAVIRFSLARGYMELLEIVRSTATTSCRSATRFYSPKTCRVTGTTAFICRPSRPSARKASTTSSPRSPSRISSSTSGRGDALSSRSAVG